MTVMTDIQAAAEIGARDILDGTVRAVQVVPDIDYDGEDVLRVTIILQDDVLDSIKDAQFFDTLIAIKQKIRETGEPRRATVNYATPSELADDGDSES